MLIATLMGSLAVQVAASEPLLLLPGAKAPEPAIAHYLSGERPAFFEPGRIYVLCFWNEWEPTGSATLQQLEAARAMQQSAGVCVVAIGQEREERAVELAARRSAGAHSSVTQCTDPDGSARTDYVGGSGVRAVPAAFIIKDSIVQWIGHPAFLEDPLASVVRGDWNTSVAAANFAAAYKAQERSNSAAEKLRTAVETKDWSTAIGLLERAIDGAPAPEQGRLRLNKAQMQLLWGQFDPAYALIDGVVKLDPSLARAAAAVILHTPDVKDRRVARAIELLHAKQHGESELPRAVLAELGFAHALAGDYTRAVEFTRRAMDAGAGNDPGARRYTEELTQRMREYESRLAPAPAAVPAPGPAQDPAVPAP